MSKEFFNRVAVDWDEMVNHDSTKIKNMLTKVPDINYPQILDAGSGTGVMIPFLKERYGTDTRITAVDFAENMINISRKKHRDYTDIEYLVGDLYELPLFSNHFDLIICYSVFPHFEDKKKILHRFYNLLAENGRLVIFHSQSRLEINKLHQEKSVEVKNDRLPAAGRVATLAAEMGFTVEEKIDNDQIYLVILRKDKQSQ